MQCQCSVKDIAVIHTLQVIYRSLFRQRPYLTKRVNVKVVLMQCQCSVKDIASIHTLQVIYRSLFQLINSRPEHSAKELREDRQKHEAKMKNYQERQQRKYDRRKAARKEPGYVLDEDDDQDDMIGSDDMFGSDEHPEDVSTSTVGSPTPVVTTEHVQRDQAEAKFEEARQMVKRNFNREEVFGQEDTSPAANVQKV